MDVSPGEFEDLVAEVSRLRRETGSDIDVRSELLEQGYTKQAVLEAMAVAPPLGSGGSSDGALWLIGGLTVSLISYLAAANGGTYIIATGAIGYGLKRMLGRH